MRRLVKVLQYADLDQEQRLINYYKWSQDDLRRRLLSPEIVETAFADKTETALTQALQQISTEKDPINKMLFLDSRFFLPDHNLNYTDKTCMRYGVEARVPLLDPDLVALAAKIPTNFKQTFTQGKAIFKQAMEKYLPHEVIYRPKTHFGSPLRRWVRQDLQPVIARLLNRQTLESRGLFSAQAVSQLLQDTNAGKVDGSYIILSLLCIEIWCQLFIDGTPYNRIKI
jgi:asparagine synthase (glutamine-hydrolysing)